MGKHFVLYFLMFFGHAMAQAGGDREKVSALFLKVQKAYEKNTAFNFRLDYKLFATYTSAKVTEQYGGIFVRNGVSSYTKIGMTEFLRTAAVSIKVDNESKLMQVSRAAEQAAGDAPYNLSAFLNNFKKFEIRSEGNIWVCILTGPEVSLIPYGKVIVHVAMKDYRILKQEFYLLQANSYSNEKGQKKTAYPRLEISFSGFQVGSGNFDAVFKPDYFFRQKNKSLFPSKNYTGYKIVD